MRVGRRCRPRRLIGDKGYSYPFVRRWLWSRGIKPVIPRRSDQLGRPGRPAALDRAAYRGRNVIERCVNRLKACRRVATRYDKLATSFLAMVKLAMLKTYLRELRDRP